MKFLSPFSLICTVHNVHPCNTHNHVYVFSELTAREDNKTVTTLPTVKTAVKFASSKPMSVTNMLRLLVSK